MPMKIKKNAARSQLFQDIGLQIADTLGEMKGAVMKSGKLHLNTKTFSRLKLARAISKLQRQDACDAFSRDQSSS